MKNLELLIKLKIEELETPSIRFSDTMADTIARRDSIKILKDLLDDNTTEDCILLENNQLKEKLNKIHLPVIQEFKKWQEKHPDKYYQMDEIHEFISGISRGDLFSHFCSLINCL